MASWNATHPDRRHHPDRRDYWRGGRRSTDWPTTLTRKPQCPRCQSPEVRFVEGTPETLFWSCHRCRHPWSSTAAGELIVE